jgi:predicted  nucleic acid-binding Zn-ribbon protein
MEQMQRLTAQMDRAVAVLQEQNALEHEVHLLIRTASSLIDKLESRDKEIMKLRSELMLTKQQLSAYVTIDQETQDD